MRWEREYERWRDMGHTWGPGVDDVQEYSEAELAELQKEQEAFQKLLASYRVAPRQEYLQAGKELTASLPARRDRIYGTVSYNWRQKYNDARLSLCRQAAESLGYSFGLFDRSATQERHFSVATDYYGWLPNRSGNIHSFAAFGITNMEDCLQLAADFAAIGAHVTTYFDKHFHYCCNDTGMLRYELEHWCSREGRPLPTKDSCLVKPALESQVTTAQASAVRTGDTHTKKVPLPEQSHDL